MSNDFEAGGRKFKINKLDTFLQFHISRKLAPLFAELAPEMVQIKKDGVDVSSSDQLDKFAKIIGPFANQLARLSKADADLVLFGLLCGVEIQQTTGNWAFVCKVVQEDPDYKFGMMIQTLELPVLVQAAGRCFGFHLSSFFGEYLQKSQAV